MNVTNAQVEISGDGWYRVSAYFKPDYGDKFDDMNIIKTFADTFMSCTYNVTPEELKEAFPEKFV